jgi:hypothetical protein
MSDADFGLSGRVRSLARHSGLWRDARGEWEGLVKSGNDGKLYLGHSHLPRIWGIVLGARGRQGNAE